LIDLLHITDIKNVVKFSVNTGYNK